MDKYSHKADMVAKALDIPEILETILNHLDIQRLKVCRSVSLQWCNEISRMFLTRVVPRYFHPVPWTLFQELVNTGKGLIRLLCPFQEIYAAISNENVYAHPFDCLSPPQFPITRLTLSFITSADEIALTKNIWLLLQSCSQTLTHLETHFWSVPEGQDLLHLKFVQLKALSARYRFRVSREPSAEEFKFFILVISSAPKLSHLELHSISCTPELLRQAPFKNIEKLFVGSLLRVSETWTTLCSFESDKLKSLSTGAGQGLSQRRRRSRKKFCSQFSSTLEHAGTADGSWELSGLPNVRRLDFDAKQELDLSTFPSLREVRISSMYRPEHLGISSSQPSRTVRAVHLERLGFPTESIGRAALVQLLNCFPLATYWRINYHHSLPDFIQAIEEVQFPIQKLGVVLSCRAGCPCNRSRSAMKAAVMDLVAFSSLHLLKDLRELELHQSDISNLSTWYSRGRPEGSKPFPYNVSTIKFSKIPQLRALRIFSGATSIPQDLKALEHLDISIELIVNSGTSSPNWSDSILPMKNVTIYTKQTEFL